MNFFLLIQKVDLLNEILIKNFLETIPQIKISPTPWITDDIKKSLKEHSKLSYHKNLSCYKNGQQKSDYDKVLEISADCSKKITQAKNDCINKMTDKLQNRFTAPKTYWAILSCLLYNKKILAIPPLLLDGKFVSDFCEKAILLIIFPSICTPIQNTRLFQLL